MSRQPLDIRSIFARLALCLCIFAAQAHAQDLSRLEHEAVVAAPLMQVWEAMTTAQGQESWMVAHSEVDFRLGGTMRAHYDPAGRIGDEKTIENTIIAFDAPRMYAIKVSKTPEGFPFPNAVRDMWTVVYLDPVDANTTRVRAVGLGFTPDEESQKMRAFFDRGNAWTMKKLQERFAPRAQ